MEIRSVINLPLAPLNNLIIMLLKFCFYTSHVQFDIWMAGAYVVGYKVMNFLSSRNFWTCSIFNRRINYFYFVTYSQCRIFLQTGCVKNTTACEVEFFYINNTFICFLSRTTHSVVLTTEHSLGWILHFFI